MKNRNNRGRETRQKAKKKRPREIYESIEKRAKGENETERA